MNVDQIISLCIFVFVAGYLIGDYYSGAANRARRSPLDGGPRPSDPRKPW